MLRNEILNIHKEELPLYNECCSKILRNLDKKLQSGRISHNQVSKILSMRWFLTNEFMLKEI